MILSFQMKQSDCFLSGDNKCFAFLFHLQQLIFSVYSVVWKRPQILFHSPTAQDL